MNKSPDNGMACPLPLTHSGRITMAHGGGGTRMHELIDRVFLRRFENELGDGSRDAALLPAPNGRIAFTTDSFVVDPLFFPGGDIGSLAVHGTVNDLAMAGARPQYLSAAFILEEGFEIDALERIADSMHAAAETAGIRVVTGDTKVIERRDGTSLFINTSGVGVVEHGSDFGPKSIQPGDHILINGDLGRHGMAIMSTREGFELETPIESDSAPLWSTVSRLLDAGVEVHCLRDLTRGGLASGLNELSAASGFAMHVVESRIPVDPVVRGLCELLGFDPLHVANEGRFMAVVAEDDAARVLELINEAAGAEVAADIGVVEANAPRRVTVESLIGVTRALDMLSGEQLPRIC